MLGFTSNVDLPTRAVPGSGDSVILCPVPQIKEITEPPKLLPLAFSWFLYLLLLIANVYAKAVFLPADLRVRSKAWCDINCESTWLLHLFVR